MGKKSKGDAVPSVSSVANRDMLQRLNFLYQASAYLTAVAGPSESSHSTDLPARKRRKQYATVHDLSRAYLEDAKLVAQKTTVRMCACSPSLCQSGGLTRVR
jgi:ribonuclease P protein subunit RPR2